MKKRKSNPSRLEIEEAVKAIKISLEFCDDLSAMQFLSSVNAYYDLNGYLTRKQLKAANRTMDKIADRTTPIYKLKVRHKMESIWCRYE